MDRSAAGRPPATEYDPYYGRYIDRVRSGEVIQALSEQVLEIGGFIASLDPPMADHRYAPGKWTVRQVVRHVLDTERIFATRALRIARGESQPLPGFDENAYAEESKEERRSLSELSDEFAQLRLSNLRLFEGFTDAAWGRVGNANGSPISVRAIAWILAGHADHHLGVLRERYAGGGP